MALRFWRARRPNSGPASPLPGKVVVHPVFVRYFFEGDLEAAIAPVLREIEARLSWQPQSHLPLRERIVKVGHALLALKEMEYLGATQSGAVRRTARASAGSPAGPARTGVDRGTPRA